MGPQLQMFLGSVRRVLRDQTDFLRPRPEPLWSDEDLLGFAETASSRLTPVLRKRPKALGIRRDLSENITLGDLLQGYPQYTTHIAALVSYFAIRQMVTNWREVEGGYLVGDRPLTKALAERYLQIEAYLRGELPRQHPGIDLS